MRFELIALERYFSNHNPIVLDDYSNQSEAIYACPNPKNKTIAFYKTDEERDGKPRCDYLLITIDRAIPMNCFIELKGGDNARQARCCRTEWDHAFHQLYSTYEEYSSLILENEEVKITLCTSMDKKRIAARYRQYKWYKRVREDLQIEPNIRYVNEMDTLDL